MCDYQDPYYKIKDFIKTVWQCWLDKHGYRLINSDEWQVDPDCAKYIYTYENGYSHILIGIYQNELFSHFGFGTDYNVCDIFVVKDPKDLIDRLEKCFECYKQLCDNDKTDTVQETNRNIADTIRMEIIKRITAPEFNTTLLKLMKQTPPPQTFVKCEDPKKRYFVKESKVDDFSSRWAVCDRDKFEVVKEYVKETTGEIVPEHNVFPEICVFNDKQDAFDYVDFLNRHK